MFSITCTGKKREIYLEQMFLVISDNINEYYYISSVICTGNVTNALAFSHTEKLLTDIRSVMH